MITQSMIDFIKLNKTDHVLAGVDLSCEMREIETLRDVRLADRVRFTMVSGKEIVLLDSDIDSASNYEILWDKN